MWRVRVSDRGCRRVPGSVHFVMASRPMMALSARLTPPPAALSVQLCNAFYLPLPRKDAASWRDETRGGRSRDIAHAWPVLVPGSRLVACDMLSSPVSGV